ncbi:chemotaxis protein CheW [Criblamydia sequanensis]|uniref:Chemotaxis protein CheW n=1 Tax=Candidatus Criblamydia sequanensis CRIB-18 TaxID=1437425 RepID=A0A090CY67_9BACT|nr:chemotaxis protein CheW [Criblamydia sequanensis]CDR33176.1 Chemotaxis protein CheW [Criblamydia sequanensis CRIB-18]
METDSTVTLKTLLKKRAKELAKPKERLDIDESLEVLTFNLSDELYGIETKYAKEVFPLKTITPLPTAPPFIMGLSNLRRRIISIIDLRIFFSLTKKVTGHPKAILIRDHEKEFALYCNEVLGIRKILLKELQVSLPTLHGIKEEFLKGITKDLTLLDGSKLLNSKHMIVDEFVET